MWWELKKIATFALAKHRGNPVRNQFCCPGGEMADALVSGTSGVTSVSVRLRSRAQKRGYAQLRVSSFSVLAGRWVMGGASRGLHQSHTHGSWHPEPRSADICGAARRAEPCAALPRPCRG